MINIRIIKHERYTVLHIDLGDEPLAPAALDTLQLPRELVSLRHLGLILSGRGPVWLFGWLVHWAHPFAWLATFDPRLAGAVVISRHVPEGPAVGTVVPMPAPEA